MITKELTPTNHHIVKLQSGHEVEGHPAFNRVEDLTQQISTLRAKHQDLQTRDLKRAAFGLVGTALFASLIVLTIVSMNVLGSLPLCLTFAGLLAVSLIIGSIGVLSLDMHPKAENILEQLHRLEGRRALLIEQ